MLSTRSYSRFSNQFSAEIIRERADAADLLGELAAETWRDIADAAERILRESGGWTVCHQIAIRLVHRDKGRLTPLIQLHTLRAAMILSSLSISMRARVVINSSISRLASMFTS
jgi:hypothetical protein